ncbi:hypothetical protein Tsubulata_008019 [Turnera subulata]|uniref:Knottin scorpion toxin-like domain-containing protein n=1 Tax=Turnera subulata TaxID=218843 RepID=A0A9Q0FRD6_9ROSI|nr:hypothetical protein Tsubulata_008019 [Turnera subulata]
MEGTVSKTTFLIILLMFAHCIPSEKGVGVDARVIVGSTNQENTQVILDAYRMDGPLCKSDKDCESWCDKHPKGQPPFTVRRCIGGNCFCST